MLEIAINLGRKELPPTLIEKIRPKLNSTFFTEQDFLKIYNLILRSQWDQDPAFLTFLENSALKVSKNLYDYDVKVLIISLFSYNQLDKREKAQKLLGLLLHRVFNSDLLTAKSLSEELAVLLKAIPHPQKSHEHQRKALNTRLEVLDRYLIYDDLGQNNKNLIRWLIQTLRDAQRLNKHFDRFCILENSVCLFNEQNAALEVEKTACSDASIKDALSIFLEEVKVSKQDLQGFRFLQKKI